MRGRFLARLDADCLGEHVEGDRLLSSFEFAIATKTMHVLQRALPADWTDKNCADKDWAN